MKKLITLFVIITLSISVLAQAPQKMSYQAVIRNNSGVLVANQGIGMKISILQGTATGTIIYQEIYNPNPQTNINGLITVEIGGGISITGTFSSINWANGSYFLKTETDPTGGTNYTVVGTSQILSVPYALYAQTAKTADYNDLTNKPWLFDGTWTSLTGKPNLATVASSANYNDLTNKPLLFDGTWANITGKPTTVLGFGITDAIRTSHAANDISSTMITNWNTAYGWGNHSGLYKLNSYVPTWNDINGKPFFANIAMSGTFADLLSKPTDLEGYGITNSMNTSHPSNSITSTNIANWTMAYYWGNHSGLYRPIAYVPTWSEITNKPTSVSGFGITDAVITSGDQTISGNKTFTEAINASDKAIINVGNPISAQDAATRAYVDNLIIALGLVPDNFAGIITDINGNIYKTVKIGEQIWMAENLKTTKYNDGTEIPNITDNTAWVALATGAYCDFDNIPTNSNIYGRLYNWFAIDNNVASNLVSNGGKNVCPINWHVPSDTEWKTLETFLGGEGVAGGKLKELGTTHWLTPNLGATNEIGFTALPGGGRDYSSGTFFNNGHTGYWWFSSPTLTTWAYHRFMHYNFVRVERMLCDKRGGFSVRCIKDN